MAGRYFQLFQAGEVTEAFHSHILARLAKEREVTLGSHLVEHGSGNAYSRIEMLESVQNGGYGVSCGAGVDHQHHGDAEQSRDGRAASPHAFESVEQAHDALRHTHIRIRRILRVDLLQMLFGSQPAVEIDRHSARSHLVIFRIDVIGAAFIRLHGQPPVAQQTQQSRRKGRLASSRS